MSWTKISRSLIVIGIPVVIIYDIGAQIWGGLDGTLSMSMWRILAEYPILSVLAGFAIGHLLANRSGVPKLNERVTKWLRIVSIAVIAVVTGFELYNAYYLVAEKWHHPENNFIRFLIGLLCGRWVWGDETMEKSPD